MMDSKHRFGLRGTSDGTVSALRRARARRVRLHHAPSRGFAPCFAASRLPPSLEGTQGAPRNGGRK